MGYQYAFGYVVDCCRLAAVLCCLHNFSNALGHKVGLVIERMEQGLCISAYG